MYKLYILLQVVLQIFRRKFNKNTDSKNILIFIERPGIGDTIVCLNALYNLSRVLKLKEGYELFIATTAFQCNFLKSLKSTFNATLIELDLDDTKRDCLDTYKENLKQLKNYEWNYIISFERAGGYIKSLVAGLDYGTVILPEYTIETNENSFASSLFDKLLINLKIVKIDYKSIIVTHKEVMEYLLTEIFENLPSYEYKQYIIPMLLEKMCRRKYCVFCCGVAKGHVNEQRGWNINKYEIVLDYILKNTNLDILICGNKDDVDINNKLYYKFQNNARVINFTAKTTFEQWVEMLRGAEFVIGNDSGYVHLAAMLKTQVYVLSGYWNVGRFLPYENDTPECSKPIDIRIYRPSCALCNLYHHVSEDKRACDECIKEKGIYKCIDDITVDMVIEKIKSNYIMETL